MRVNKNEFKKSLELVKPGLASKEIVLENQFTSFAFLDGTICTYNDEISISHPLELDGITGAVLADELYRFIAKTKGDELDIELSGSELTFTCGKAKAGFSIMNKINLPIYEEIVKKGKWQKLPADFMNYLKFASMSCSKNLTDPKLTCVHINKKGFIESGDNYRIFHYTFDDEFGFDTLLLPSNSVNTIIKYAPSKISEGYGWIHFKNSDGTVISCRTFNDKYVDTAPFIKLGKGGINVSLPEKLNEILERAIIFTEEEKVINSTVEIEVRNKKLIVRSKSETAWFEEYATIKYLGEPFSFVITNYLMKDILSLTNDCIVFEKVIFFKGDKWVYVTALIPK